MANCIDCGRELRETEPYYEGRCWDCLSRRTQGGEVVVHGVPIEVGAEPPETPEKRAADRACVRIMLRDAIAEEVGEEFPDLHWTCSARGGRPGILVVAWTQVLDDSFLEVGSCWVFGRCAEDGDVLGFRIESPKGCFAVGGFALHFDQCLAALLEEFRDELSA
jgi:hypothetical protein